MNCLLEPDSLYEMISCRRIHNTQFTEELAVHRFPAQASEQALQAQLSPRPASRASRASVF